MSRLKQLSKKLLPVWLAVITFILTELAAANSNITEKIYSKGLYPIIASLLSRVSNIITFSIDDTLYIGLTLFIITLVVLLIFRRVNPGKFSLLLINTLTTLYISFYWLWGFNYFRVEINQRLNIPKQKPSAESFTYALDYLISSANSYRPDTFDISCADINILVEESYKEQSGFLNIDYPQGIRSPKPITFSRFFAKAAISGYYGPFFSEVHINSFLLPVEYPWTLAHEKAHQLGITSEAEANFYAWYVCNSSKNQQIKYAANLNALFYFLYEAKKMSGYKTTFSRIDKEVVSDMKQVINHWQTLRNTAVEKAASKANDTYLKTNKVKKGVDDYDGVVRYITEFLLMKKIDIE